MFHTIFLAPIYNMFVFFLNLIPNHDVGIAIILTTVLIKIILLKPNLNSQKSTYLMREAQVEIDEVKKKYKGDSKKIAEETMKLYKTKKIKPFASILIMLIQIPVFFALYYVFKDGINLRSDLIYSFNHFPIDVKHLAFGFIDLSQKYWWIGIIAGLAMFIYSKRQADTFKKISESVKKNNEKDESFKTIFAKNMQTQMVYFLPIISGISAAVLPAVLGVYWATNNILNVFQDIYIKRKINIDDFIKKHEVK